MLLADLVQANSESVERFNSRLVGECSAPRIVSRLSIRSRRSSGTCAGTGTCVYRCAIRTKTGRLVPVYTAVTNILVAYFSGSSLLEMIANIVGNAGTSSRCGYFGETVRFVEFLTGYLGSSETFFEQVDAWLVVDFYDDGLCTLKEPVIVPDIV